MTCLRVLEPVEAAHLEGCGDCRAAKAAFAPLESLFDPGPPPAQALELLKALPHAHRWSATASRLTLVHLFVALGGGALVLTLGALRQDAQGMGVAAMWLLLICAGPFAALSPAMHRQPWLGLLPAVGAAMATLGAAGGVDPPQVGMSCLFIELGAAVLPLALALRVLTGFAFSPWRAVSAGLAAAGVGAFIAHLHCPGGSFHHLLGVHLAPAVALAAVAGLARRRLTTRSFAP